MAGRADQDLHLVEVVLVQAGVPQSHLVQGAGHGLDVLVDGGAGLVGAQFRVHVVGGVVVLEFNRVGLLLDAAAGLLRAGPAELAAVPSVDAGPLPCAALVRVGGVERLARVRVDAGPVVEAVRPLVAVVRLEVAVDEVVRQPLAAYSTTSSSDASLTVPEVLSLAGWVVFSLPRWFDGTWPEASEEFAS